MRSSLYKCEVMHHRLFPKQHRFVYSIFMFCLDLDELNDLHVRLKFFSRNKFNWFSFYDHDHIQFPFADGRNSKSVKQNIIDYLQSQNVVGVEKVTLVTNAAVLGYSFNPISFYLCFDQHDKPLCAVAEVCNTHHEMKLYLLDGACLADNVFQRKVEKHFYVSPFASLEASFNFIFKIPGDTLHMRVDDYQDNKRFLLSALTGEKKELTDARLIGYGLLFPLITLKIIGLIYWQAFVLLLKGVPHQKKDFNKHLQRDAILLKN